MKYIGMFLLVAALLTACKKEETPSPYTTLQKGIMEINKTYIIEGMSKISFAVPDRSPNKTVQAYAGDAVLEGRNFAIGTQVTTLTIDPLWKYIQFRSNDCSTVKIVNIE